MSYFDGCGKVQKLFWGLLMYFDNFFFNVPTILTFDFDSILGSFLTFGGNFGVIFLVLGALTGFFGS